MPTADHEKTNTRDHQDRVGRLPRLDDDVTMSDALLSAIWQSKADFD